MHRRLRAQVVWVVLISVAYVLLFVPPNLTGAKDANMLAAFQIDEWTQYPFVMGMTTPGDNLGETLSHILVYHHYIYGYPFYLTSALAILPLRAANGFAPLEATNVGTTANLLVLRQLSPIFMVIAVALLTYCWTGFRQLGRTLLVMFLLLTAPAVFDNNLWWHAESLTLLFVALTIFALYRDDLRFGRWFVVAAVACGLGAATKLVGFWFFLTVAVYLILGWRRSGWRAAVRHGLLFAGLMAVTIVLANPLLLVPSIAREIIAIQQVQTMRNTFGGDLAAELGPLPWYRDVLRMMFGYWWVYALALGACIWAVVAGRERKLLGIITLTYVLPFAVYLLFFVAYKPARYFLPVMLPLLAALGYEALYCWDRRRPARLLLSLVTVAAILSQSVIFLQRDVPTYRTVLGREAHSPVLYFYHQVAQAFLDQALPDRPLTIYRDPSVYVAPHPNAEIVMNWYLPTHAYVEELQPDLILLQQHNIERHADPTFVESHIDPERARLNAQFYADAAADRLPGYRILLATDFGLALVRQ